MCQHVSLEIFIPCAFVFTLLAAERPFSGVNKHMLFQIISRNRQVGTLEASVGFLSSILSLGLGCERHHTEFGGIPAVSFFFFIGTSDEILQCCLSCNRVLDQLEEENHEFPEENCSKKVKVNKNILRTLQLFYYLMRIRMMV